MVTPWQDVRYATRMLLKNPGFTIVAVSVLALGIGANTSIFSLVNTVLLSPLPYRDADRLVMVWETTPQSDDPKSPVTPANFADWRGQNHVFEEVAASTDQSYTLTGAGEPETLVGYRFSASFFSVLRVRAMLGRTFLPEEDRPGNEHVVVLSHQLWQRRFGGDREIIGKPLTLNGASYTVIGVMPPEFKYSIVQLWTPLALEPSLMTNRELHFLRLVARLKPNVTIKQAQAEMEAIARGLQEQYPQTNAGRGAKVISMRDMQVGDIRPALLVLLGAVSFVLLIACANVANLLLARTAARQKELAVRAALGASRLRLAQQFLTESILLALLGGALGLLVALWSTHLLLALFPNNIANLSIPRVEQIPIDASVLGFTLVTALLTGVVCGLLPIMQFSTPDLNEALKEGGRGAGASLRARFRSSLVVFEVALSLVLLTGAGLMIKSFLRLQQADFGFNPENVLTMQVMLPQPKYKEAQKRRAFVQEVLRRVETLPGVVSAGAINFLPLSGFWGTLSYTVEGQTPPPPGQEPVADNRVVTEQYFRTMSIPLLKGRYFTEHDDENAPQVVMINNSLAHRIFGAHDEPLGKRLNLGDAGNPSWAQIVGVVGDVKAFGLESETHADIYRPYAQAPFPLIALTVRTTPDPARLAGAVRNEIWAVDKDQPVFRVISMEQSAAESVALRRVSTITLGTFSVLALVLAAVGLYGVISYSVTRRTHEIGIRLALGARPRDVLKLVVGQGMLLALIGVAVGLAAAFAITRLMASLLYGVTATDPIIFVGVSLLLAGVALLACYIPARRATRVDPMVALRYE